MKKFKITKGNRVYIVDAKSHIDAINKVKSIKDGSIDYGTLTIDLNSPNELTSSKIVQELNNKLKQFANKTIYSNKSFTIDSAIRDYSPEVYINELEKLIPEYIRLDNIRQKIIDSLKSSGKIDYDTWRKYDYLSDAKVKQWLKQVKELDKKWNKLLDNLSRFKGTQSYRRDTNKSDKDIWFDDVPYPREIKGIQGDVNIIRLLSGKNKDSISQWKPGMSEIGLFQISYKKGTVNQSILVKAATKEDAINKFTKHKPDAEVISVNEYPNPHFGEPILDSSIKDEPLNNVDQINSDIQKLYDIAKQYGPIRTEQNKLNNEFEQQNMQVVRNRFYNDPTVKRALKQMEDLDTKWNAIVDKYKVLRQYSIPQDGPNRFMGWNTPTKKWVDDIKKQLIK